MKLKTGDVVAYGESGWCKHGLALVQGDEPRLWAADTYWNDRDHSVPLDELEGKPVLGNIVTSSRSVPFPLHFEDFQEEDKFVIPMGSCSAQRWVRIDAEPDRNKVGTRLRHELQEAYDKVMASARDVEYRTKQLMRFETRTGEYRLLS